MSFKEKVNNLNSELELELEHCKNITDIRLTGNEKLVVIKNILLNLI